MNCSKLNIKTDIIFNEILSKNEQRQLEEWTELQCNDVLFDSNIDNVSQWTSEFNERILGKNQLVFLIEDTDGEKFGYYLDTEVIEKYHKQYDSPISTNRYSFHFNLNSNGRLGNAMKFEIKDIRYGGYRLFLNYQKELISLGNISLYKENMIKYSYCLHFDSYFYYYGIENALSRKSYPYTFDTKRILVIEMK